MHSGTPKQLMRICIGSEQNNVVDLMGARVWGWIKSGRGTKWKCNWKSNADFDNPSQVYI